MEKNSSCRARASSAPPSDSLTSFIQTFFDEVPVTNRLSDGRNNRDAVPPRSGRPRRRRLRLYRAAAGGAAETEDFRVHQRAVRQDRIARTGSGAGVLRSAGRSFGG